MKWARCLTNTRILSQRENHKKLLILDALQYLLVQISVMGKKDKDVQYGPRVRFKGKVLVPGKWTLAENRKYVAFIAENKSKLENPGLRLSYGIYRAMSNKIPGRTSEQCRDHHRRMIKSYKSIEDIIVRLENVEQKCTQGWSMNIKSNNTSSDSFKRCKSLHAINIMVTLNIDSIYEW